MKSAVLALAVACAVRAYIPAQGTNDTNGLDLTDPSSLRLTWPPVGVYSEEVSYQLAQTGSSGYQAGPIVHFDESNLKPYDGSATPWIALISCDKNATDASQENDIFSLAQERGAIAALLYSTKSEACLINPYYASPDSFDQILDIFATKKKSAARLIESQFTNVNSTYSSYNSRLLNQSHSAVMEALNGANTGPAPPFLMAALRASNATSGPNSNSTTENPNPSATNDGSKPNTGLAMIVLYAITGCVSVLFCVVILSGAIRAIRHPERYGPRSGDPNVHGPGGVPQTRAAGLTRAILDTFPVVKFGRPAGEDRDHEAKEYEGKDVELVRTSAGAGDLERGLPTVRLVDNSPEGTSRPQPVASGSTPSSPTRADELTRAAIGVETCPICILDFADGDDLRVLPCEGRHRFHRDCVDQWLLDLSSSCPLCREDFGALEAMAAGNSPDDVSEHVQGHSHNRFSKYLRFARHRREQGRGAEPEDAGNDSPTDPEYETATGWRPRVNQAGNEPRS